MAGLTPSTGHVLAGEVQLSRDFRYLVVYLLDVRSCRALVFPLMSYMVNHTLAIFSSKVGCLCRRTRASRRLLLCRLLLVHSIH